MGSTLDWHTAVYCSDEGRRLQACLDSLGVALAGKRALITVVLNGGPQRNLEVARAATATGLPIEFFHIPFGDKSNAINQFNYNLRVPACAYAGVDGYVEVGANTFSAMEERLGSAPHAVAVTGVPDNGRTMREMGLEALRTGGALLGQLHAWRPEFLDRMTGRGIKLPIGLYRGDGLLGSMAAHDLAPLSKPWDNSRVLATARATFTIPCMSLLDGRDVRRLFHRRVRQMQGLIENKAIASIVYRSGYEGLPEYVTDLIQEYLATHRPPQVSPSERPFQWLALRKIAKAERPDPALLSPVRITAAPRPG